MKEKDYLIIAEVFNQNKINFTDILTYQVNDRISDYLLDDKYLLRLAKGDLSELPKLKRVSNIDNIQKIYYEGYIELEEVKYSYVIFDYFAGDDLYNAIPNLSNIDSLNIGKSLARNLKQLHTLKGTHYDIGHYIPTIPKFSLSWKEGHIEYVNLLKKQISKFEKSNIMHETIDKAFQYIDKHIDSLDFQEGPVLLHNDLHPKNIIVNQGKYVGLIDWECSQYGEFDFDFVHLFHWCVFPNEESRRFDLILEITISEYNKLLKTPRIDERLTIYQLEHEINQVIWNKQYESQDRIKRINAWIDGEITRFLKK
jgi:aminoglycoside phosphotransferase (APT) family kinase protein